MSIQNLYYMHLKHVVCVCVCVCVIEDIQEHSDATNIWREEAVWK